MNSIKAAALQVDCCPAELDWNNRRAEVFIREGAAAGAELIVLPELVNFGYSLELIKELDYDYEAAKGFYANLAAELGVHLVCGLLEKREGQFYNSQVVFRPNGQIEAIYRKINLFPLAIEDEVFEGGREPVTFEVGDFKCGLLICYDIRFPELSRRYLEMGVNCLIVSSAFPFPRLDHWRVLLQSRAIENQCYLIAANRTGRDGEFQFLGNSSIIDPWGTVKASMGESDEGPLCSELTLSRLEEVREAIPCLESKRRLDLLL